MDLAHGNRSPLHSSCLRPPLARLPDSLFALDEQGHLLYNSTTSEFWECPVDLGEEAGGSWAGVGTGYYLDVPQDMKAASKSDDGSSSSSGSGEEGAGKSSGRCRKVTMDATALEGWFCNFWVPLLSTTTAADGTSTNTGLSDLNGVDGATTFMTTVTVTRTRAPGGATSVSSTEDVL